MRLERRRALSSRTPVVMMRIMGETAAMNAEAVIPSTRSREVPIPHDETIYKLRNRIERCFNKLKHFRRFATRYDRRADYFLAFVHLAAICMLLNLAPVDVDSS